MPIESNLKTIGILKERVVMDLNVNQMAMELRVLRADNARLGQIIENLRAQHEKEKAIENFLAHAMSGFASQARALQEDGPQWVAEMAFKTMTCIVSGLEALVEQQPEAQEQTITEN